MLAPDIRFTISEDNQDCKILTIDDKSTWSIAENQPAILEICLPGANTPITLPFRKNQSNDFNSITLGLNCPSECGDNEYLDIPDGLYTISLIGSPDSLCHTVDYIRNCQLCRDLDKMVLKSAVACAGKDDDLFEKICEIQFLKRSAQAHIRCGDTDKAMELNNMAVKIAEKNC